jgi:hypothetical protein
MNGKVNLPNPKTGQPLTAQDCAAPTDSTIALYCGLKTLDGFSTFAPPISENSDALGALTQGNLDATTLSTQTVGLVPLASTAPEAERTQPKYQPCLNCLSSKDAAGNTPMAPQQLQWKLDAPLDEKTTYLAFVTTGAKDDTGKPVAATPAFALLRSPAPLVDANGKSTVDVVSDAQAAQLEPLRAALKPAFDGLEAQGIPRSSLALAFPFTTQSEATVLDQLAAYPAQVPGLPEVPLGVTDETTKYQQAATAQLIPLTGVGKIFSGTMIMPVALTGPSGTLNPTGPQPLPANFIMIVPDPSSVPAPPSGYPITIFGHGLTNSREDVLAIASSLSQAGRVVIAIDTVFHGDRSTCTGSKQATGQSTDDASCANPTTMRCDEGALQGICVLRDDSARLGCAPGPTGEAVCASHGQGRCAADSKCQGAGADFLRDPTGVVVISGWNFLNLANFFTTRDNFRYPVVDLSQVVRELKSTQPTNLKTQIQAANGGAAVNFDLTKIDYVGQSLGAVIGTLFNAVSPDTQNAFLNAPGGALPQILLNAPSFAAQKEALLAVLKTQGIVPGTPAFDQFIGITQWIVDPADPVNMGYRLTHPVDIGGGVLAPPASRKAAIQFIQDDPTIANIGTFALLMAANRQFAPNPPSFGCVSPLFCYEFTEAGDQFDATTAVPSTRHRFLLKAPTGSRGPAITTKAQTQMGTFIVTGSLP